MEVLIHIGLGIVLSFLGSIPFGTINVTVIETAILRGFRSALWVISGAAIIEFIQAALALKFSEVITRYPVTELILFWISIPIFIALGIYYIRQKRESGKEPHAYSHGKGFIKGVIVSALNVLAIPYWVFYGTYLTSVRVIDPSYNFNIFLFSFGVLTGTVIILMVYARLGEYAKTKFSRITHYIAPGVGYFFFFLALIQIGRGVYGIISNA
jgi:threonine/homoserine/homoserine lactone efflux protein